MTIYPIPIASSIAPTTVEIVPNNWVTAEVLVELPENKDPSITRVIPDNNNSMPLIIVSIAIIVTAVGLCCLFCMILDNVHSNHVYICCMIHNTGENYLTLLKGVLNMSNMYACISSSFLCP